MLKFMRTLGTLFAVLSTSLQSTLQANERAKCSIRVGTNPTVIASCTDGQATIAVALFADGNRYHGFWQNGPEGFGIMFKPVLDPSSPFCGYDELAPGIWASGSLTERMDVVGKGLMSPQCVNGDCQSGLGALITLEDQLEIGRFHNGKLRGLGLYPEISPNMVTVGFWAVPAREKEFIQFEVDKNLVQHFIPSGTGFEVVNSIEVRPLSPSCPSRN